MVGKLKLCIIVIIYEACKFAERNAVVLAVKE